MAPSSPRSRPPLRLLTALLIISLAAAVAKVCRGCDGDEQRALLRIAPLFSGEFRHRNWDVSTAANCCAWEGVGCGRRAGRVVSLSLAQVGLHGALDGSVFAAFAELQELDLSFNQITSFASPSSSGVCNLDQVESLELDDNMLHGIINPCLGKLRHLRYLSMGGNFLRGEIPPSLLGNLTQIETIHLGENNLTGTFFFSSLANNSKLHEMVLSSNHRLEIETEAVTWAPLFQLEYLNLRNCIVNKRSNGVVPTFLSTQMSLSGIDLSHCSLRGKIPPWLVYNLSDFLLLNDNSMEFLEVEHINGLAGNMTSPLQVLDLSNNSISMAMPIGFAGLFTKLEYMDMSSNLLFGGVPSLAEVTSLQVLDLSHNRLTGELLPSLTGNASVLTSLLLSNNNLTGPVPPSGWGLQQLVHLSLENNRFSGRLSPFLPNSSLLETLNVRNNDLSGIIQDGLLSNQQLGVILLGGNSLQGAIPIELCFNEYLHFLDLSNNQFSGEIPGCFYNNFWTDMPLYYNDNRFPGNVTQQMSVDFTTKGEDLKYMGAPLVLMTAIDFSMNHLSGTIPPSLGLLRKLRSLNLSHNHLAGPIPENFMYLQDMESLDLSHNHLNGSLPVLLASISSLSSFSVAYNNLSGEIPFQSQLTTFNESSFEGNENLCGEIISKKCSTIHDQQGVVLSSDAIDTPLIYWSFVAGSFALGFWGFIAFLTWNAGFKRRLCALMDKCMYNMGWSIVP
ncbi:MDIS1-interacting receptor like kinase 2 [Dichanthelium oligosanthes]|uniref:MDIS1-interacting receptor like kinase 2 n=1 Tax=Dichanthelium oligosanthes TaxID=888268 RepID=A0A1E5WM97_9POAL|nr:MDIS1-interacting receptor like kinase 2 [Dichanthelium oligosanthes]